MSFKKLFKKRDAEIVDTATELSNSINTTAMVNSAITGATSTYYGTVSYPSYGAGGYTGTTAFTVPTTAAVGSIISTVGSHWISGTIGTYVIPKPDPILIRYTDDTGKEIVHLRKDGSVVWATEELSENDAAKMFSRYMQRGAEFSAGITEKVKIDIRDSVFNDIIELAKENGSLSASDLTLMLEGIKIMEKLRSRDI